MWKTEWHIYIAIQEKCIVLSESHADLNEELNFLRGRLESLELSLHQAEEAKRVAAKGIGFQSKVVTDLVFQLALERDRLHKQVSTNTDSNFLLFKGIIMRFSSIFSFITKHMNFYGFVCFFQFIISSYYTSTQWWGFPGL